MTTNYLLAHVELARLYNELGREKEAQAEEAATRRLNPHIALEILRGTGSQKEHKVEPEGILARSSTSLKAYAYVVGGVGYFFRWTQEANIQAQQLWEKASELDPQFAAAHTLLGATYLYAWVFQWSQDPQTLEQALTLARRVLALDDSLSFGHSLLGMVYLLKKQYEQAIVEGERAIALNPNDGDAHGYLGLTLASAGQPEEAVRMVEKGMRLNPRFPASLLSTLGWAYRLTGRSEEARDAVKRALNLNPNYLPAHLYLAVLYSESGLEEGARGEGAEVLRLSPNFSLEVLRQRSFSKDPAEVERIVAALRKAGLK